MTKLKILGVVVLCTVAISSLLVYRFVDAPHSNEPAWTAPANPDVQKIHQEAMENRRARKYARALAQRIWFHENANRLEPGMAGVRLSFALGDWADLAAAYPPAMDALIATRDKAERNAMKVNDTKLAFDSFSEAASINHELLSSSRTVALFKQLDRDSPQAARVAYRSAQESLIEAKEYALCGKYIEPEKMFARIAQFHEDDVAYTKANPRPNSTYDSSFLFRYSAAQMVGLLALNNRQAEAEQYAIRARAIVTSQLFSEQLDLALKGQLPPQLKKVANRTSIFSMIGRFLGV
jgi:hypothetical protein